MERGACFKKEVIHLYFVILATQRSLMVTTRTMLEECRARSQIEVGLRSGKGGSRDGLYILIISMSVSPKEVIF